MEAADNSTKRGALRELPQAKNRDMRSAAALLSPPILSFRSPSPPLLPAKRRKLVQKKKLIEIGFVRSTGSEDDEVDDQRQSTPTDASTDPPRTTVTVSFYSYHSN
ncbi:hypothetical protein V501_09398 [Pseudogymnoascus sp. VKM F-4519 (FW-2642)]|nr:hypothetical protein V501_09398 [Pseudogymnoascus sp. VKM F-4519 (FW-2642)]